MSVVDSFATKVLETIGMALWGFKPNLMRNIVEQHGAGASLAWFVRNMPTYEATLKQWGAIRTHLLATELSVLNGCPYCTYGHAYALQLHYFKDYGRLMPVDEDEIVAWHRVDSTEAIKHIRQLISEADLSSELPIFERMLVLRQGTDPALSPDDQKILHMVQMFDFLNRCGIRGATARDQPHDPISKDTSLRSKYARLRNDVSLS